MIEKKYSKAEAKKEAERYIRAYPRAPPSELKAVVWSDYTNKPRKYRRPLFASEIIKKIMGK